MPATLNTARAETALFVAPTRVEINDQNPVQEIRVTNMSTIARSYNLSIQNIIMNTNGQTTRVDNFDYSAKRMIRFVPRHFDVPPGGKQIVRIMARFPKDKADGEYHAHLEFLENIQKRAELNKDIQTPENRARMNAQISYVTAIPIITSKGEIKTEIGMKNLKLNTDKNGNPEISMILTRSGNGQGNTYIEAEYISPDGSETKAAVRRSVVVYREINERQHSFALELLDAPTLKKGGQIKVKLYNRAISETDAVDTALIPIP